MVDDQYGIVVFADFRGDSLQFVALSSVVFADGFGVVAKTRRSHDRDEIVVRSVTSRVRNEWKAVQSFRIVTVGYVGSSLSLLVPQNRSAEVFEQDIPVVFDQPADIPEIPFGGPLPDLFEIGLLLSRLVTFPFVEIGDNVTRLPRAVPVSKDGIAQRQHHVVCIAVAADRIGRIGTVAMPSQAGFAVRLLFFQVCRVGGEQVIISRIDAITSYYGVRID